MFHTPEARGVRRPSDAGNLAAPGPGDPPDDGGGWRLTPGAGQPRGHGTWQARIIYGGMAPGRERTPGRGETGGLKHPAAGQLPVKGPDKFTETVDLAWALNIRPGAARP